MSAPLKAAPLKIPAKRILVVDDEPQVANTIRMVLVHSGHSVEIVPNAEQALGVFAPEKYDLIISDLSLGKMNGLDMADLIKAQSPAQPIILITAYAEAIQRDKPRSAKVDFVLGKPFSLEDLQAALRNVFPIA